MRSNNSSLNEDLFFNSKNLLFPENDTVFNKTKNGRPSTAAHLTCKALN